MNTAELTQVFEKIDQANAEDPNHEIVEGKSVAKELIYGQRMSNQLATFAPNSSPALQIAARAQHIQRWKSQRSSYPAGLQGYKQWRSELGKFHAEKTEEILQSLGHSEKLIADVKNLLQKKQLKQNPDTQTLEDVICLVFLEYYLEDFAAKHDEEKLIAIIQKTWRKMSEHGQQAALKLPLSEEMLSLVGKALSV